MAHSPLWWWLTFVITFLDGHMELRWKFDELVILLLRLLMGRRFGYLYRLSSVTSRFCAGGVVGRT